jgi:biopolymer transport protein ExbD
VTTYSAQRVRSKTRTAVRKREEFVEQMEMESGELNLIPYLDMVTNLMLFILATVSAGLLLSQISTTLPDRAPKGTNVTQPQTNPDDQPLGLYVSIKQNDMILWSVSRLEGTLSQPLPGNVFPRLTNTNGSSCEGPYNCESNNCIDRKCAPSADLQQLVYDYRGLNNRLFEIANRRYAGKARKHDTYSIVLQADGAIPYSAIVSVMAAMRCKLPDPGKDIVMCRMPNDNPEFKASGELVSKDGKSFNTEKAAYDPKTMALFPSIQFSSGFE